MAASDNISSVALIVILLVLAIATTLVALRVYTRIYLLKQLGLDDYCVVVTLIFAIGCGGTVLSTIPYGLGRRTATLSASDIEKYLFPFWLSIVFYNTTLALIKLTFLFQYYRVLAVHKMKKVIWVLGVIIMAWAISQILIVIFSCNPVDKFWRADLPGSCMPNLPFWYVNAAGNIATDLAIFIMPLPVLQKLQLRRKQKYFLMAIFSLGFFTCAISLIRLVYLNQGPDFTFDNVPTSCWSVGELCCGITCACLPTLKPLLTKIKPQWITSYASRHGRHTGTGKLRYGGKSGGGGGGGGGVGGGDDNEGGTELKSTSHRSRTTHESVKTLSSTLKSKNYTILDDDVVDVEQGLSMPTAPSAAAQAQSQQQGPSPTERAGRCSPSAAAAAAATVEKQSMPAPGLSKGTKAMEVLGMGMMSMNMTGVSTHVYSGRRSSIPSVLHHDGRGGPDETNGESLTGIAVKRSVVVETIVSPPTTPGMRRTKPREF